MDLKYRLLTIAGMSLIGGGIGGYLIHENLEKILERELSPRTEIVTTLGPLMLGAAYAIRREEKSKKR